MKNFEAKIELKVAKNLNLDELQMLENCLENAIRDFGDKYNIETRVGDLYKEGFFQYGFFPTSDLAKTIISEGE